MEVAKASETLTTNSARTPRPSSTTGEDTARPRWPPPTSVSSTQPIAWRLCLPKGKVAPTGLEISIWNASSRSTSVSLAAYTWIVLVVSPALKRSVPRVS